jgi:hypothetical protein
MATTMTTLPDLIKKTKPELYAGGPGSGCHGSNCGRPRSVKQSFQTNSGYSFTILRPSRKGISKASHAWQSRKDQFKGKYKNTIENARQFSVKKMRKTAATGSVYDAKYGKGDRYEGHGKTIFVHKDLENMRVVVQEVPHNEMNHSEVMRSFKFTNFGKAAAFLNKRYGIKQALPKPGAFK